MAVADNAVGVDGAMVGATVDGGLVDVAGRVVGVGGVIVGIGDGVDVGTDAQETTRAAARIDAMSW